MPFVPQQPKPNLYELDQLILKGWKDNHIFEKSVEQRPEDNPYRFYDGPPFITGEPHYGTLCVSIAKDVVPRFWTMKGKRVERVWGRDCHGIPMEEKVQKKLGLADRHAIEELGIDKFTQECYTFAAQVSSSRNRYIDNVGRRVDMDKPYRTMDNDYMESVRWVFKSLREKGLIYKGKRVSMYSTKLETPISSFEVAMDDTYGDQNDPTITVMFDLSVNGNAWKDTYALAWTTTPWTIPINIALAVNKELSYAKVLADGSAFVLAEARVEEIFKGRVYEIVETFTGEKLVGLSYKPPFEYVYQKTGNDKDHKIYHADFVTDQDGTGIAHEAPEFGEVDFQLAQQIGLTITEAMDSSGHYTTLLRDMSGIFYRDANPLVIEKLQAIGRLFAKGSITHRVAFCPRTNTPLVYKAQDSWFINVQSLKQKLYEKNEDINRYPNHFKHGRFLKSLESAPDRCISRTRYWGTPMPIYAPEEAVKSGNVKIDDMVILGSREELYEYSKEGSKNITKNELNGKVVYRNTTRDVELDMHRPYIDDVWFMKDGKKYTRIPEVLDCRVESASMPYAQVHYPFENKEKFEGQFPADYVVEYTGQIRAWFYVMHVISVALFDKPAFRNVNCYGVIGGNDGRKMSKSYGNYPDPRESFEKYGGDSMRMSLLASPLFNGGDAAIAEENFAEAVRAYILPLRNAFYFFTTYANIDKWENKNEAYDISKVSHPLDKFLYAKVQELITTVNDGMEGYDLMRSSRALGGFLDDLTNRYIRRSRRRFRKEEIDQDKKDAYSTLYYALVNFCQVAAPFMPFVTEHIFKELTGKESVHLTDWPEAHFQDSDKLLVEKTKQAQDIISIVLAARSRKNIRVRQPLQAISIGVEVDNYFAEIIADECNVKHVDIDTKINSLVTKICKPDGKYVGETFGGKTKEIFAAAKTGNFTENADGSITVAGEILPAGTFEISYIKTDPLQDIDVDKGIVVKVDWTITPELELEGFARDLVRFIQDARKEADFDLADRIQLSLTGDHLAVSLIEKFTPYIQDETLSTIVEVVESPDISKEVEIGSQIIIFSLKR